MFKVVWNMVARRQIRKFQQILRKINQCNNWQMNSFYSSAVTNILRCLRALCASHCRSSWSITTRTCTPTTPRRSRVLMASLWSPSSLRSVPIQSEKQFGKKGASAEVWTRFCPSAGWTVCLHFRFPSGSCQFWWHRLQNWTFSFWPQS